MTGRWLTFCVNIYCKEGGWEGSTWKCKASYFSSNTACCMESKGTKQPRLPTANIRAVLSGAYVTRTGKTILHNSVSEGIFIDVFITSSRDLYMLVSSFTADYTCICKRGWDVQDQAQLCQFILFCFFLLLFFYCLFSHLSLSPPSLCLSISFSLLNSLPALAQALVIAGSLLNSHNALL